MKGFFAFMLILFTATASIAQDKEYTLLLSGASFASPDNTWFEIGCERLNAKAINRAIGAQSIVSTAGTMNEGALYSQQELEDIDALVIMHVHDRDVFNEEEFGKGKKWEDYSQPMNGNDYAGGFDYVIKRYMSDCYNLKNVSGSKYYGTKSGKPAIIVLCTHWHDARTIYNTSVRLLAAKWGLPVVEFDANIGFSRHTTHPVTGEQVSVIFSDDTETINGKVFGWHASRGKNGYIQQKMAAIFAHKMSQVLPLN